MKILLTKDCAGHSKGDTIELDDHYANTIIGIGFARKVEKEHGPEKLEVKPVTKVEIKTPAKKLKK